MNNKYVTKLLTKNRHLKTKTFISCHNVTDIHPSGVRITLSGSLGYDAKKYQERDVKKAIQEVKK